MVVKENAGCGVNPSFIGSVGMKTATGFSLVELIVAVAILSLLASIALPQYNEYVTRGRLVDSYAQLAAGRVRAEQFYQDNRTYVGMPCPANTGTATFACQSDATTYTITATGTGGIAGFVFTIDQANVRATTGAPSGWSTNAGCWIASKSGGCT